ncbi:hypothetical protein HK097_008823, partial [Rhizophlyctis rosea]
MLYQRANALEVLAGRLGLLGFHAEVESGEGHEQIELIRGSRSLSVDWKERQALFSLLLSVAEVDVDGLPALTDISNQLLTPPTPTFTPTHTKPTRPILPDASDVLASDASTLWSSYAAQQSYDVVYPRELFEGGLSNRSPLLNEEFLDDPALSNSSTLMNQSIRPSDAYEAEKTRSIFGALSHPSANLNSTSWDTAITLSLPPLPIEPVDSLQPVTTPPPSLPPEDTSEANVAGPAAESKPDADIWMQLRDGGDTNVSRLRTWDMLGKSYVEPSRQGVSAKITSAYLTEAPPEVFDAVYDLHFHRGFAWEEEVLVVDEKALVKGLLNISIGVASDLFVPSPNRRSFVTVPGISIRVLSCGTKSVGRCIYRFLKMGTQFKGLERIVEKLQSDSKISSATTHAFANSLSSYLTFYNATIALLHSEAGNMGLLEVYHRVETLSVVVEGLHGLFGSGDVKQTLPTGPALLSLLYESTLESDLNTSYTDPDADEMFRLVLLGLLRDAGGPWCQWVQRVVGWGGDVVEEFGDVGGKDGVEGFWEVDGEMYKAFPSFVPRDLAYRVVHGARCLKVLEECQLDHPMIQLRDGAGKSSGLDVEFGFGSVDVDSKKVEEYARYVSAQIAEFERMKVEGEERKFELVREEGRKRKREMDEALNIRREGERKQAEDASNRKREKEKELQTFIAEHARAKNEANRKAKDAAAREAGLEAGRKAEVARMVEEEKRRMEEEHAKRMEELDREVERVRELRSQADSSIAEIGEPVEEVGMQVPAGVKTPKDDFGVGALLGGGLEGGSGFFGIGTLPGLDVGMETGVAGQRGLENTDFDDPLREIATSVDGPVENATSDGLADGWHSNRSLEQESDIVEFDSKHQKDILARPTMIDTSLGAGSQHGSRDSHPSKTTIGSLPSPPPSAPMSPPAKSTTITDASILWLLGETAIISTTPPPVAKTFTTQPDLSIPSFVENQLTVTSEQPDPVPFECITSLTLHRTLSVASYHHSAAVLRVLLCAGGGRDDVRWHFDGIR